MSITPRFGDVDGLRHVNNCVPPIWFETAREPFFRLFHPNLDLAEEWNLVMARYSVDFISQLRLNGVVEIRTFIKKIGRSSVTVHQEAWQNGLLGARGEAVLVYYDLAALKSLPIPESIREELAGHMIDPDNPPASARSGRFPAAREGGSGTRRKEP